MPELNSNTTPETLTLERLDDQICWYSRKSTVNQGWFKNLKCFTIAAAALIPLVSTASISHAAQFAALLGVLIATVEGLQQLNQYHANWANYRSTAESLKHEKFLYLAKAGPYRAAENSPVLLAERVEALVAQEELAWSNVQTAQPKDVK